MKRLLMLMAAAGLLSGAGIAQGDDVEIVFAEDRVDHATYDPRVTQSRHEEQVIVQVFDSLLSADENGNVHPGPRQVVAGLGRRPFLHLPASRRRDVP